MKALTCSVERDPDVDSLMKAAVAALRREDEELNTALSALDKRARSGLNRGLGYWLYETTLVYVVFKEWIRHRHYVVWDWPNIDRGSKRVDLRVRPKRKGEWGFEFKWCNTGTSTNALEADAKKLREMMKDELSRGFLVGVWWNKCTSNGVIAKDVKWIQDVAHHLEVTPRFFQTFPTHILATQRPPVGKRPLVHTRGERLGRGVKGMHYFAVVTFEVNRRERF